MAATMAKGGFVPSKTSQMWALQQASRKAGETYVPQERVIRGNRRDVDDRRASVDTARQFCNRHLEENERQARLGSHQANPPLSYIDRFPGV